MYKIIIKAIILLFIFSAFSYSEEIKDVEISGNKRISNETVLILGNISLNENFDDAKLNKSLKKLYESNFFSDIDINFNNGVLKIILIENPIIEDIEFTGLKNKTFIEDIKDNIVLKNRMSFTEIQLQNDINLIKNILKTSGFYFAKVEPSITKNSDLNSVRLKINIDKGQRARIKEIVFIGDKKIKDKKLVEVIASEEHKFWKFVSNKVYLNQSLISLDKRLLENYYRNLGYYKVKVLNSFAELNDSESSFKLVFNIDAGQRYFFNKFSLNLPEDYNKKDFKKVEKIFSKLKDERYSLDNINLILEEIDKIASLRLYDFIDAQVNESIEGANKINFDF